MDAAGDTGYLMEALLLRAASNKTLFHLQALRGLAASLVVLSHAVSALRNTYSPEFAMSGYVGVGAFFIISGFIIYRTSRTSFGTLRGSRGFMIKRLIRIFPIYWIATALFVVLSPHRAEYTSSDIICSFILLPHYIAQTRSMDPLVGQGWSLHYELLFYVIFACGLCFSRRNGVLLTVAALIALVAYGTLIRPVSDNTGALTLMQVLDPPDHLAVHCRHRTGAARRAAVA